MAPKRPTRSGLIAVAPIRCRAVIGLCCTIVAAIVVAIPVASSASADPVGSGNVPLPVPAPLPKTGTAPPPAAAKPATDKAANDKPVSVLGAVRQQIVQCAQRAGAAVAVRRKTARAARPHQQLPFERADH